MKLKHVKYTLASSNSAPISRTCSDNRNVPLPCTEYMKLVATVLDSTALSLFSPFKVLSHSPFLIAVGTTSLLVLCFSTWSCTDGYQLSGHLIKILKLSQNTDFIKKQNKQKTLRIKWQVGKHNILEKIHLLVFLQNTGVALIKCPFHSVSKLDLTKTLKTLQ